MSEKPITFTAENVQRILAGGKTETSRPMKPQPTCVPMGATGLTLWDWQGHHLPDISKHAPYQPGDLLWIREPWRADVTFDKSPLPSCAATIWYEAANLQHIFLNGHELGRLRPAMFLPKRLARPDRLRVLTVSVKRVQELTTQEIRAEGIPWDTSFRSAVKWRELWSEIYGAAAWQANPWVWRYKFELVKH